MRLPWTARLDEQRAELETRADSSYTDALVAAITANAKGSTAYPTATAALEAAAGFVGRAFATAEVTPEIPALSPAYLSMVGRALVRRGELVSLIRVHNGELELPPAESHDVDGEADPDSWTYRVSLGGPSHTVTHNDVPYSGVLHFTYSRDPERPWRGNGPLQVAQLAGRLSAETAASLADDSSLPRGALLPIPTDGQDDTVEDLRADLATKGKLHLVQGGDWNAGAEGGRASWVARRFGADPPGALVELNKQAFNEVLAACGLSPALFDASAAAASREAYRQALHATIAPLGKLVAHELSVKLEQAITLDWAELRAGDIAGRARAFQSMVGAGMDAAKAAALSGLMVADE